MLRVRAVATSNVTIATALNAGDTLAGHTLAAGELVLLQAQTAPAENGLYRVGPSPSRDPNWNRQAAGGKFGAEGAYDLFPGMMVWDENTDTIYFCTSSRGGTLDTTGLTFTMLATVGSPVVISDDLLLSGATPTLTFTDTDTGASGIISGSSGAGSLFIKADANNAVANSFIVFEVDAAISATLATGGLATLTGTTPALTLTDTDTGSDALISGSSATGSLILAADTGNEVGSSTILFLIDGSTVGTFTGGGGVQIGAPTGGDKGAGTINATDYYVAGTQLSEYISDTAGAMWTGNTETSGVSVDYQDSDNTMDITINAANLLATLNIVTDTWTPTLFNTTNVAGSTAAASYYIRVDDYVFFWGTVAIDPTLAAPTATVLGMSLPIASNFGAGGDAGGTFAQGGGTDVQNGGIEGDAANDRLSFKYAATNVANALFKFSGGYRIL